MSESGASVEKIGQALGHSDGSVTEKHYNSDNISHINYLLPMIEEVEAKIQEAFNKICKEAVEKSVNMF